MTSLTAFILGAFAMAGLVWLIKRFFGFPAQSPKDYTGHGPTFDIRTQLNGAMLCDGIIYGPTGRVSSRFTAKFDATWDGNTGRMHEHFNYDSGTVQDREWQLTVDDTGKITAKADDLIGDGTGTQAGSGVKLSYRIKLPDSAGGHVLDVTDWMYLLDNGTIVNRSQFRKFGFKVGELVATMRPADNASQAKEAA
ncbi:DUF3833 domain-containing protein [Rhodobacteraceae bacterium]|nr:DUF3833 domain-containing protein [Paracoccaceae bacterium]